MRDRRQREEPIAERLLRRGIVEVALEPGRRNRLRKFSAGCSKRSRLIPVNGSEAGRVSASLSDK